MSTSDPSTTPAPPTDADAATRRLRAAAAAAWGDALTRLAAATGGRARTGAGGVLDLRTGVPVPTLNGVLALGGPGVPEEDLVAAVTAHRADHPWSVQTRTAPSPALREVAAARGLTGQELLPLLVRALPTAPAASPRPGTVVRSTDPAGDEDHLHVLAEGFGAPVGLMAPFAAPAVLGAAGMSGVVVEEDGRPVATAFGVRTGDVVGVVNVAVLPGARRRGFGALATRAVLERAAAEGATGAYLHATPLGAPLYRHLGFTVVEEWTVLLPGQPTT